MERPTRKGSVTIGDRIADLEASLQIDENALEDVCREQTTLLYRVARELSIAISRRDAAKQDLEYIEARVALELREQVRTGEKITADEVKARVKVHPDYLAAVEELTKTQNMIGEWAPLKEAYQQRSYMLNHLVDLYLSNYYGNIERREGDVRTRDATVAREQMGRMRMDAQSGRTRDRDARRD